MQIPNFDMKIYFTIFPILFILFSLPTIFGFDSDFAYYSTAAKMLENGMGMYGQVYDHKPPLYHHVMSMGEYINKVFTTKLLGFYTVHFLILASFYFSCMLLLKQVFQSIKMSISLQTIILLFSVIVATFIIPRIHYSNLNGGIVYFATTFEILAISLLLKIHTQNGGKLSLIKHFLILSALSTAALIARLQFSAFLTICIFIIISKDSWLSVIYSLFKFILISTLFLLLVFIILVDDFKITYQALIVDNILYTGGKNYTYFDYFKEIYLIARKNIYSGLFIIITICITIIQTQSIKLVVIKVCKTLSNKIFLILITYLIIAFINICLVRANGNPYQYYIFSPIFIIACLYFIKANSSKEVFLTLTVTATIFTIALYAFSLKNVKPRNWNTDETISILNAGLSKDEQFFTVDFNSWLYLLTDTLPMIKSQYLHPVAFPTHSAKVNAIKNILLKEPKYITFSGYNSILENETFIIKNIPEFADNYSFKNKYKTPYDGVRLWEKK